MKIPATILGLLLALWIGLGAWICAVAPYGSGTDESIRYVAFAAATNRWAGPSDAAAHGIYQYYYPPLYFLLFAPFFGDEPAFNERYPPGQAADPVYRFGGGRQLFSPAFVSTVPTELLRLYRAAKFLSLAFGVGVVLCLAATLRLLFDGPERPWLVLGGTAPLLLLPQFLYYQTLVNNDALVNFLGALAILCFVAAARRAERGDASGVRRLGIACSAAIGLGLLTKQSAAALFPLLPGLALLSQGVAPAPEARGRAIGFLRPFAAFSAVAFACGGWWLLRLALAGDPGGTGILLSAHPWDTATTGLDWGSLFWVLDYAARSYVGLFAGSFYGIPDRIYALYLAVPIVLGAALLATAKRPARAPAGPALRLAWRVLAATAACNLALLLLFNLKVNAPHGRLLFPTVVATHAYFALALRRIAGGDRRRLAALACLAAAYLGGLFLWTFANRIVIAVKQPAEVIFPLWSKGSPPARTLGPIFDVRAEQSLTLPPGELRGLRLRLYRRVVLPQLGTVLHARLRLREAGVPARALDFLPSDVGDNDAVDRWTDLGLARPLTLSGWTRATLELWADRPWFLPPGAESSYGIVPRDGAPALGPLVADGEPSPLEEAIAITAVYR